MSFPSTTHQLHLAFTYILLKPTLQHLLLLQYTNYTCQFTYSLLNPTLKYLLLLQYLNYRYNYLLLFNRLGLLLLRLLLNLPLGLNGLLLTALNGLETSDKINSRQFLGQGSHE